MSIQGGMGCFLFPQDIFEPPSLILVTGCSCHKNQSATLITERRHQMVLRPAGGKLKMLEHDKII